MNNKLTIKPPKYVIEILKRLEQRDFKAYLVGGCVRDLLLGKTPQDWDVTTSATPDQVMELFEKTVPTGIRHGTVTVITPKGNTEVTTFRREGDYQDHRRPDSVKFISDLKEDLSRRDFTMNAIAIQLRGNIIDPFGGYGDIEAGQIRCVGRAEERFGEDALRMLRALRFAAKLGFTIDRGTEEGIRKCAHLAGNISAERVMDEVQKILLSDNPQIIWDVIGYGLMDSYLTHSSGPPERDGIIRAPRNKFQRWAALCAQLTSAGMIESNTDFLKSLRLDNKTVAHVGMGVEIAKGRMPGDRHSWKRLLWRYGTQTALCAAAAADALADDGNVRSVKSVIKSGECFSMKRLAVNGDDLIALGCRSGVQVGRVLEELLEHVINVPGDNKKNILITKAVYMLEKSGS